MTTHVIFFCQHANCSFIVIAFFLSIGFILFIKYYEMVFRSFSGKMMIILRPCLFFFMLDDAYEIKYLAVVSLYAILILLDDAF